MPSGLHAPHYSRPAGVSTLRYTNRRMLRYARYAAAVVFALLAVGIVALWVRSHRLEDSVICPFGDLAYLTAETDRGVLRVQCALLGKTAPRVLPTRTWQYRKGRLGPPMPIEDVSTAER